MIFYNNKRKVKKRKKIYKRKKLKERIFVITKFVFDSDIIINKVFVFVNKKRET